jgi:hypothetical protein
MRDRKMTYNIPLLGVIAGGVLVSLGMVSLALNGEMGFREYFAVLGGALMVIASMYIYVRMNDSKLVDA